MKAIALALVALALTSIAAYAHDDAHRGATPGMMPGSVEGGQAEGKPGNPTKISRAIHIVMRDDMKFTPAQVNVQRGETIKFVLRNAGRIKHEMVIGSMANLKQHAELMRKFPGMEHDEPNQMPLEPGKSGRLVWQFTKAGTVDFACLQPGHFEAGMMGKVTIK